MSPQSKSPARRGRRRATPGPAPVYFGSVAVSQPSRAATLPAKLRRILAQFDLRRLCQGAWVPIKMHLGGGLGYTTIHPLFVRTVADALREAGGKPFVIEGGFDSVSDAAQRGYTAETLGCPIVAAGGPYERDTVPHKLGYRGLDTISIYSAIRHAPCLVNFSHVKGHGDCGYGGACKNIAMGCVDAETRARIHGLEGGIDWLREKCTLCGRCAAACDTKAITIDRRKQELSIFFHHCRYCRHCVAACPRGALEMSDATGFQYFQEGMARVTKAVLAPFAPERVLHINLLTNITMFCDCWGMTTPSLVPDIGVMAAHDMVALESASLAAIRAENLLPGTLIGKRQLLPGRHLLEMIHGKDPYIQVRALERHGLGRSAYELIEVH